MSAADDSLLAADGPLAEGGSALAAPRPFVKWVGGKRTLREPVLELLGDFDGRYHEPFVGGGAIFFALVATRGSLPGGARLADRNERLVRTWRGIQQDVDGVLERLHAHACAHCRDYYYAQRAVDIDEARHDAEVAAWFVYLNKTGFNGLYRVNRQGRFNVPIGRYANPRILDEPNLLAVHRVLQQVELVCEDFEHALDRVQPGDAVYLDPPYVPLSRTASFTDYTRGGFDQADQERLARRALELKRRGVRIVLSNHDTPDVRKLYPRPFRRRVVQVGRPVNRDPDKRGHVDELLIY